MAVRFGGQNNALEASQATLHQTLNRSSAAAEQDRMRNAAIAGGGNHYHAPDAVTLARIFREIALTLPVVLAE